MIIDVARDMIPAGYMAKRIVSHPDWLTAPAVDDICSVSGCISQDFADYMSSWKHNGFFLFNTCNDIVTLAADLVVDLSPCRWFYYEVFEREFEEDTRTWSAFAPDAACLTAVRPPEQSRLIGFDVVTFCARNKAECSPLSCNRLATKISINRHCLFDRFVDAYAALEAGQFDHSEPGPFRILAVRSVRAPDLREEP